MSGPQTSIFARPDTLLGVCEAIGADLGFNPGWLRAALACGIFFSLPATLMVYLGLGAIVAFARWRFPAAARPAATGNQLVALPSAPRVERPAVADEDAVAAQTLPKAA